MVEIGRDVVLILIGAFVTLIVDFIKTNLSKEKREISYSVEHHPLVVSSNEIPSKVVEAVPSLESSDNVIKFRTSSTNSGKKAVDKAKLTLVAPHDARIIADATVVQSEPAVGVTNSDVNMVDSWKAELPSIVLQPGERLDVSGYVWRRDSPPEVQAYWTVEEGELEKVRLDPAVGSFESHVRGILINYIISLIGPALFGSFGAAASALPIFFGGAITGVSILLGTLWRVYFLLRIVPHVQALMERWRSAQRVI